MQKPKVIGIGFHKTATTSLRVALEKLGYRVTGPNGTDNSRIADEVRDLAFKLLEEYDAVQDNPWPLLFREVDRWYPGSKFILTVRPTERWIRSTVNYFGEKTSPMREWIYGVGSPRGNEEIYIARYERHNREVLEYFRDRPGDLLVLDITNGEGWEKLCPFLDLPTHPGPFPHKGAARPRHIFRVASKLQRGLKKFRASQR